MRTKITQLFVILLSWLALPVGAQTYKMTTGTRVSLSDLTVGNNYAIFSTAISGTNTSGLAYAGYICDTGSAFKMNKPGKLPKDYKPSAAEIWTLTAKEGSTVTFKNASTGRYISSNTSSPLSSAEASVKFYDYGNLPSGINRMGSGESSVSDDGLSCINCETGDFTNANVYGIVTTDEQKGIRVTGQSVNYAQFCYPFALYQAVEQKTIITFNFVKDGVTLFTTTETNVSIEKDYDYIVPNNYKGYQVTSATDGTGTASAGSVLRFAPNETDNVVTVTLGQQQEIRDFNETTQELTLTEITDISQIQEGQKIIMQIFRPDANVGRKWTYMYWDNTHQIGKEIIADFNSALTAYNNNPYYHNFDKYIFTITKAETDGDAKIVQIMSEDGFSFPELSSRGAITMGAAADYTLSKNSDGFFHLQNGTFGVDNSNAFTVGSVVAYNYGETAENQRIKIYAAEEVSSLVATSSIPRDVLGNPVQDGGKYGIRMPGRATQVGFNRYLSGSAGSNYIVQGSATLTNSMKWTVSFASEGLMLKSEDNGNYAASFKFTDDGTGNSWNGGPGKEFLTAATADLAEVWFPAPQTITAAGATINGYTLKTTTGNLKSNYLSNHGGVSYPNMGFHNDPADNGAVFQFVPLYNVNFVDENGLPIPVTINDKTSATGEFVLPHGGYYTFGGGSFPSLTYSSMETLLFNINGVDYDFYAFYKAMSGVNDNMLIKVKNSNIDYNTPGAQTTLHDKFDNTVVSGKRYFLKMRQNANGTTDAEIDANVAFQTKNAAGQIAPLAWNGSASQVWRPYGSLNTIVLRSSDDTYLKVENYPASGIGYGTSFGFDATLANATPFSAWPCDNVLHRYFLTSATSNGSIYQYTSDVVNSANTAGLNTQIVKTDVGEMMQFVPAIKLSFIVKDENGDEYANPTVTYNGLTFDKTAMGDVYVEEGKGFSSLIFTTAAGESAIAYNDVQYRYFVGSAKIQAENLSSTIASLTGDATITIQKRMSTSPYAIDDLFDVNGDIVESNKLYRIQFTGRGNYYLTQVHNSEETMASDAFIANGKQHWYVEKGVNDSIMFYTANEVGYLSNKEDATGDTFAEAIVSGLSASLSNPSASVKIQTVKSPARLVAGSTFALRWNQNDWYFNGDVNATSTLSEDNYFTLVTATDSSFYLMRTSTAGTTPAYVKKPTVVKGGGDITETTNISEAAPIVIEHVKDSIFMLKTYTDPANPTTYTYLDKRAGDAVVPCFWKDNSGNPSSTNSPIKFYQVLEVDDALNFAFERIGENPDEYVYRFKTTVNEAATYLASPGGVGNNIGFARTPGIGANFSLIPVSPFYDVFGDELRNSTYRIELPGRAAERGGPVTLTMNGEDGTYHLSDREQYYINPQSIDDYRNYYWLSDIEENVLYRNDSTQVWTLEFNGIEGVWIKNINGKYWKAERFVQGVQMVTDTVSSRENATLWDIRPVSISGMSNTYNLIAANDTIATPTNWYFSNHTGGNNNMGFNKVATNAGSYFTFTPVKKISRTDAYNQGIINAYGFSCYGIGYKNTNYAAGDGRDSIQGYELPKDLWLPYNPMSNSYSSITFRRPELIGYHYNNGITESNRPDRIIRYTGYELNEFPIISSDAPYLNADGDWTFAENTRWYAITVRACDGTRKDPFIMSQDFFRYVYMSDINTPFCDRFLFAFVGDSINGYLVYNKAEGAGRYMGSINPDHIVTSAPRNIAWLPNDNTPEEKLYSKHVFQITQHSKSGYYTLVDRYTNSSFDAYNPPPNYNKIGWNCYWHSRYQPNGDYIKNVLGTEEWTNGQTHQAASYEASIYHTGGSFYARTMTFPNLTDVYVRAFNKEYFHRHVGYLGMHTHADSVELNFNLLQANLKGIGTVNPGDYASQAEYKEALIQAQNDSLAAYDAFLENLYQNGVKYDTRMAYKLVNEKTGRWLAAKGDNNDGQVILTDVSDEEEATSPGSLWKFIEVSDKAVADNSSVNNKYYKLHNIYRSANLKIESDGSLSLDPEAYADRTSYGHDSGIGTNIDFVNDMRKMLSWAEYVIKPEGAEITGTGTGLLLSSTEKGVFNTDYDLGHSNLAARWMAKGFLLDSVSLELPATAASTTTQVYTSAVDPDKDFTWPYSHGLSAWRMTWRHHTVIRGQKILPTTSTDRPFIPAGTGILFRGPKGVKFPLLPCTATTEISSLLVSPDETIEKDTIDGKPGFKLPANSGFIIDYVNNEDIVRCCLVGSDEYTSSNYISLDGGYIFLPKTKPYIPNDADHYGSEDFTLALELEDENGNVTRIGTIDANGNIRINEDNSFYDLQGRRVSQPVKGQIYIHNGKKVYFK